MENQPQNPEFRNNPENVHPCDTDVNVPFITKNTKYWNI